MLRPCLRPLVVFLLLGGLPALAANPNEFQVFNWDRMQDGAIDLRGRLYVPDGYDPNDTAKQYPLVLFFHGAGEAGTNNTSQVNGNIDNLLNAAKNRDFFIYAPQAPFVWNAEILNSATRMVAQAASQYHIDTSRLYVTGLSLGGGATWDTISKYQGVYSSAVPICGVVNAATQPQNMVGEHIWAYHARNDPNGGTPVSNTRNVVNGIRAADGGKPPLAFPLNDNPSEPFYNTGSPYYSDGSTFYDHNNLRYTEYATGGHGIWGRVYNEQPMYDWMLSKSESINLRPGETVLFDLGSEDVDGLTGPDGRFWNTPDTWRLDRTIGAVMPFAKTAEGRRTAVTLGVSDVFNDVATGVAVPGIDEPAEVADDAWYAGSWGHDAALSDPGILRLLGLDAGGLYEIELFASHPDDDGGRGRITRFTIGGQFYDLDPVGNATESALFSGVVAGADGSITIDVRAAAGTQSRSAFVSWLSVTAVPEPASWGVVALGLAVGMRRSVRLTAGRA